MTMRERLLAVLAGEPVDRVPFVQYDGTGGPTDEIWAEVGRENMGVLRWTSAHAAIAPNCRFEHEPFERQGRRGARTTLHTPAGALTREFIYQPDLGAAAIRRHYVQEPDDYRVLLAYLRDLIITPTDAVDRVAHDLGNDGLPHVAVDRTPFQQLWVEWVCIEDLSLHLVDCPDIVHECMAVMEATIRRQCEIAALSSAPYVVIPDNITAPVIGERIFRENCVPLYQNLADRLAEQHALAFVHIDGDIAPLYDAITESRIGGIDSLSPPPDNDTSVATARWLWPTMRLFVNYPSSVHLASEQTIYDETIRILEEDAGSGLLQIQVSENVPPGLWRKSYPQIIRAIHDFCGT